MEILMPFDLRSAYKIGPTPGLPIPCRILGIHAPAGGTIGRRNGSNLGVDSERTARFTSTRSRKDWSIYYPSAKLTCK